MQLFIHVYQLKLIPPTGIKNKKKLPIIECDREFFFIKELRFFIGFKRGYRSFYIHLWYKAVTEMMIILYGMKRKVFSFKLLSERGE